MRTFILCLIALAGALTMADAWPQAASVRCIDHFPSCTSMVGAVHG